MQPEVVFKAMSDKTRQRVLALLAREELSVSDLVDLLRLPQSTVSRHLKVLRESGLIRDRRSGQTTFYSLTARPSGEEDAELTVSLMDWIKARTLPAALESRLAGVVRRRNQVGNESFFEQVGQHWDALREESFGNRFHLEAFIALLPRAWTVADIGSGTGYLLPVLARHFRRVLAVDPVEAMRNCAQDRMREHELDNVELLSGDLAALPIDDNAVDLAVSVLVWHHVEEPAGALAEVYRVIRPGGRLLLVEQGVHHDDAFRRRMGDSRLGFDSAELARMMERAGFAGVEISSLATVDRASDAPELFAITATKAAPRQSNGKP